MQLIDELRSLIADLGDDSEDLERYYDVMQKLRELIQEKIDEACVETLTCATQFADSVTGNLEKYWHNNWLSLCIWANLSKNPRIKEFGFEDVGITFSIPPSLTHTDCAFRILFMKFDAYSVLSPSYKPHLKGYSGKINFLLCVFLSIKIKWNILPPLLNQTQEYPLSEMRNST